MRRVFFEELQYIPKTNTKNMIQIQKSFQIHPERV